ncbi:MAG: hypothetical protein CME64_01705 [Halobacteriovoraceae bacterium]|nr:hypothetical protein [Halobacteriovoraceae bacterium]|tara:strand:- start:84373 stop:85038 length:666 start_codon:yes stop_codon:yes gene_type:complete
MTSLINLIITLGLFSTPIALGNGPSVGLDEKLNKVQPPQQQVEEEEPTYIPPNTVFEVAKVPDRTTVLKLQQKLEGMGIYKGPLDGKWTTRTQRALRKYQMREGITATGKLSEETLAALNMKVQDEENQIQAQQDSGSDSQNLTDTSSQTENFDAYNKELVKKVQSKLSQLGWELKEDGILGQRTQGVLKEFQEKSALKVTGSINSETLKALNIEEQEFAE